MQHNQQQYWQHCQTCNECWRKWQLHNFQRIQKATINSTGRSSNTDCICIAWQQHSEWWQIAIANKIQFSIKNQPVAGYDKTWQLAVEAGSHHRMSKVNKIDIKENKGWNWMFGSVVPFFIGLYFWLTYEKPCWERKCTFKRWERTF